MTSLAGVLSYGAAAIAFAVLTALLATSWRGRAPGVRLIGASGMTAAWAAGMAWFAWNGSLPVIVLYSLEMLRAGAWLLVLVGFVRQAIPDWLAIGSHVLWGGLLAAGWILAILQSLAIVDFGPAGLLPAAGLAIAVCVLVLLEQIFRRSGGAGRHGIKFLVIGLGGAYAYDLFLYSQAELFRQVSGELWLVRGAVNALVAPFIAIAARRNPQWSLDVFVSRQVVVFTTAVAAVGVYLLLVAAGGYYVREFGGTWGTAFNVLFLAGALVVLAAIAMSGAVRRRLRVFVSKHFFRNKYDYRVEWLRFVATLSAARGGDVRRTSIEAIAQIFESPGGVLFTLDEAGRALLPAAAWPMRLEEMQDLAPLPASSPLAEFLRSRQWVVDLEEYARAPGRYENVALPGWLARLPRARVVAPLLQQRELAGLVVLFEPPPPFELTYEDRDLLKTIGRHVATIVAQHSADLRLAESRQFEAYHRLTAFMMHDLKNSVAQLQLVVRNADRHRQNADFIDDAFATIANAVERMNRLIGQLRDSGTRVSVAPVDLVPIVRRTVDRCADRAPAPALQAADGAPLRIRADEERLAAALEHVLRNAQDATRGEGEVRVSVAAADGHARLEVIDTGAGMTPEFVRERLFRPFDSTKGPAGMGIGAHQVREYVRGLGGDVEVESRPGVGTRFTMLLPLDLQEGSPPDG
ncbi:MAG: XrtA/PEP-CTERM system histidine kinase PrsK [Gammaproteobacteria bacterium]